MKLALLLVLVAATNAQDWKSLEEETMRHFQALLRFDTSDPPGREQEAADYVRGVLAAEGIETKVFAVAKGRPNIVARLKGTGKKRPVLILGHTDVVAVDVSALCARAATCMGAAPLTTRTTSSPAS